MKIFALVDCNNFYVSCERVFNPKIQRKPVIVLSNNDGCAVSRSNEVKDLNIPMAAPYFKFKDVLDKHNVEVFSSNYALYGDMSQRVMQVLAQFCEDLEIYSIDEAFLSLTNMEMSHIENYCRQIRQAVLKATGIPVSIGIAKTKTLAKLANELAKKETRRNPAASGVWSLVHEEDLSPYLKALDVEDVWGIGRQYSKMLRAEGISTAYDFSRQTAEWVKEHMTVAGLRTLQELNNVSCHELEVQAEPKKGIASTRSFGSPVTTLEALREAVAAYTTRAAEKLRHEKLAATYLYVFVMTDRFKSGYYYKSLGLYLPNQTNYTPELIRYANLCLEKIFLSGKNYKKAGVFVTGLVPQNRVKHSLFESPEVDKPKRDRVMQVMDRLNQKYGAHTVKSLAQGLTQPWKMLSEKRSPRYTTVWEEILEIN